MNVGIFARVPALAALVVVALLATATLTLAATTTNAPSAPVVPSAEPEEAYLVVPDVRRQAYVFAKGSLEQAGFAWKVSGSVQGFAVNVVASQTPAPGTRVVADGAPVITLSLSRNPAYKEQGLPEGASPFAGTNPRLVGAKKPAPAKAAAAKPKAAATPKPAAKPKPLNAPKPAAKPVAKPSAKATSRKPTFALPAAPAEPLDEIPLAQRAKQLSVWLEAHPTRTPQTVDHWLYQHNWIVTGASFGWSGGVEALKTLIAVDQRAQKLWSVGGRSESLARRTLAEVERRAS
jgi:hypothetical protein